jgi:hypothetical protein
LDLVAIHAKLSDIIEKIETRMKKLDDDIKNLRIVALQKKRAGDIDGAKILCRRYMDA